MASVEKNRSKWGDTYSWPKQGDEWSKPWGGAEMQWYVAILPRIHQFVPTDSILEIAPGHGRWTQFLKELCSSLVIVDLSESCIEACKNRFSTSKNIQYWVNDGKSLAMVPDNSIDFIFSFDSLVHAEQDVIEHYVAEISKKLKKDGVAMLHHSNLNEYRIAHSLFRWLPRLARLAIAKMGIKVAADHWRARSMSAEKLATYASKVGMECVSQEKINWGSATLIDCISILTPKDSVWERENIVMRNPQFMSTAKYAKKLSYLYSSRTSR